MGMSKPSRCFGCSREFPREALNPCVLGVECIAHRGIFCDSCLDAHQITAHPQAAFGRDEMVH